jgi:flagellar hook-basal body complex protein FliE
MAISPIGPAGGFVPPAPSVTRPSDTKAASDGFGDLVTKAVDQVEGTQAKADDLAVKAATGELTDVHDYMIATTQAQLATELTVAVRNKAVEAFNDIMRMPV